MRIYNKQVFKHRRQELRKNPTEVEKILWEHLRGKKLGVRFWRQYGVGLYVLDFYAPSLKLGIELDGPYHSQSAQQEYDTERDNFLRSLNITTLRFRNDEVTDNVSGVLARIRRVSHPPLP